MKIKLIALLLLVSFTSCSNLQESEITKRDREVIDSLNNEIYYLKEHIELLENDIQLREDEVAYWGMKYDSIAEKHK